MNYDLKEIKELLKQPKLILTHGKDLDGLLSSVFAKRMLGSPDATIIPVDYGLLKDNPGLKEIIDKKDFLAVLDLEYMGEWTHLYCDHHLSNKGSEMMGDIVLFDSESRSAAEIIAKYNSIPKEKWSFVSRSDSASYNTDPPKEKIDNSKLKDPEYDIAWDYNDLVKTCEEISDFVELAEDFHGYLFNDKEDPRFSHIQRLKQARDRRRKTEKLSKRIIENYDNEKAIIFITTNEINDKVSIRGIMHNLYEEGLQLGIEAVKMNDKYNYFFGANNEFYDLDLYPLDIASELGGGGHKMASGARATLKELNNVLNDIELTKIDVREIMENIEI